MQKNIHIFIAQINRVKRYTIFVVLSFLFKTGNAQTWQIADSLREFYSQKQTFDSALFYAGEALGLAYSERGENDTIYANMLVGMVSALGSAGKYRQALEYSEKEVALRKKLQGEQHINYSYSLSWLGWLYDNLGEYEKAQPLYLEALEITEKTLGKDPVIYVSRLNNLAAVYENKGQTEKAIPLLLEALEITGDKLGKANEWYSRTQNNLATLYVSMRQYDKALPLYAESLKQTELSFGKSHNEYGIRLNNLASVYFKMGEYSKALDMYKESLDNCEQIYGKEHQLYSARLNNVADLYRVLGDYDTALMLSQESLERTGKVLGKEHPSYAVRLNNLANVYRMTHQYEKALPLFQEALELTGKIMGENSAAYGNRLYNFALLYIDMKQYKEALALYTAAIENNYHEINNAFSFLSEKEKEQFVKALSEKFMDYQSFFLKHAADSQAIAGWAYNIELVTKGMILQSGIQMRQTIHNMGNEELNEKYFQWQTIRKTLSQQYAILPEKRRKDLKELEENAEKMEAELTRMSAAFNQAQMLTRTRWEEVQKKLRPGETAIEFASFKYREETTKTDSTLYVALILSSGSGFPVLIPLFEEKELKEILGSYSGNHYDYVCRIYGRKANADTRLYQLILKPLEPYLANSKTLYVSPSGLLHKISFAAISDGQNRYVSDRFNVNLVSSTALIPFEAEDNEFRSAAIFGGVNYNGAHTEKEVWTYLEGTLTEARSIAANLKKIHPVLFTGNEAGETEFKQYASKSDLLHVATHGFFYPDPADRVRTENETGAVTEKKITFRGNGGFGALSFIQNPRPLMRSGLVFAGANDVWNTEDFPKGDDGVLTAQEVAEIDFSNTRLVVLSACETGLGDIKGSEGVYGLQRAFKMAGVKYIIMSLWQVPDKETVEFMETFYKKLLKSKDVRKSFNETQKEMRKKYDPYYWGAFVLIE